MKIRDLIGEIISSNSSVSILERDIEDKNYSNIVWTGSAHSIPVEYLEREFKPIMDYINYDHSIVEHPIHIEIR